MNKNELIKKTTERTTLTSKECKMCVDAITELISEVLKRGEKVYISGFGKFETKIVHERQYFNPQTNKKETTMQKIVPIFKSGKKLKEKMFN